MRIKDKEFKDLSGGGGLGATFLNYLAKAIETVYGVSLGTFLHCLYYAICN